MSPRSPRLAPLLLVLLSTGLSHSAVEHTDGGHGGSLPSSEYNEYGEEDPPFFLSRSQTFTVEIGQSIMIPCDVGNQGDHKLVMNHIGASGKKHLVSAGGVKLVRTQRLKVERTKLTILNARRQDAGLYSCSFPTAEDVVLQHQLNVQYSPSMNSSSPSVQHVVKGQRLRLYCSADGNPRPEIRWTFEDGAPPAGAVKDQAGNLVLEHVDRLVEGQYVCTAENGIGSAATATMKVVVEYPPEIVTEKSVVRTGAGDQVELVCLVRGRPSPRVSWTRDGQPVRTGWMLEGQKRFLRVHSGLPRQPRFTSAPAGGEVNSYTLTWETDSYYPIIAYRLIYGRAQASTEVNGSVTEDKHEIIKEVDVETMTENTHHVMAHTLTNLDVATDYEAFVKVKNNYGWSSDSDRFSFATRRAMAVQRSTSRSVKSASADFRSNAATSLLLLSLLAAVSAIHRRTGLCNCKTWH
ncbi:immunoglobulin superfamily member 10 [Hyalella azteca]|uniref:Immunoglobulin superfamily member 10 n=1 Tax=Hyalella azteca TaxID=294128 RepID=A0A979FWM2_HYAAZ|nr:immunoglobulin superfamily member 10 [Hyalella azteca]